MYTVYDYLNYYKDVSLDDLSWNIIDNLICSILSYLPNPSFNKKIKLKDYKSNILINKSEAMGPVTIAILEIMKSSKRYEYLYIDNFINEVNSSYQFGAITFTIKDIKIISFKGSDGSIIGWQENFRTAYNYPTITQRKAIDYLNNNIKINDKKVYINGHSKGGNLAIVSSMNLNINKLKKVIEIDNFDGQGLTKKLFESKEYNNIENKLVNIIPDESYIGILMYNKNYNIIKTNTHGFDIHYPDRWLIFGSFFVNTNTLSFTSKKLHESTTLGLDKVDMREAENTFEDIFINQLNNSKYDEHVSLPSIINALKNAYSTSPELIKSLKDISLDLLNIQNNNSTNN